MSSEVVKKRGRPKKVVTDPLDTEMLITIKTTSGAKSTKAAPKTRKAKATVPVKAPTADQPTIKPIGPSESTSKAPSNPSPSILKTQAPEPVATEVAPVEPVQIIQKSQVTPETSTILSKVRELSAKSVPAAEQRSNLSPTTMASKPTAPPAQPKSSSSHTKTASQSVPSTAKPAVALYPANIISTRSEPTLNSIKAKATPATSKPAPYSAKPVAPLPSKPTPYSSFPQKSAPPSAAPAPPPKAPKVPLASLNSSIVSQISERAGARPNPSGSQQLPKNYKPVARKVTMAIVAMPIAIVTSWVLYQRLILGEDRKLLVKPGLAMVKVKSKPAAKEDR